VASAAPRRRALKHLLRCGRRTRRPVGAPAAAGPRCCTQRSARRSGRRDAQSRLRWRRRGRCRRCSAGRCGKPPARRRRLFTPVSGTTQARGWAGRAQRRRQSRRLKNVLPAAALSQTRTSGRSRRRTCCGWCLAAGVHPQCGRERPCIFVILLYNLHSIRYARHGQGRGEKEAVTRARRAKRPPPASPLPVRIPPVRRSPQNTHLLYVGRGGSGRRPSSLGQRGRRHRRPRPRGARHPRARRRRPSPMVTGPSRAVGGAAARTGRDGHHRPLLLSRVVRAHPTTSVANHPRTV